MKIETEKDLNNLIKNQIEESTNLEYKDPRGLSHKKEIAKDISAMANSNGGIIIYGLCEDSRDHKPTRIEWIEDHQQKERIEQILQANVTPKIDLQIKAIHKTDSSKFVLVVNIPKSDKAPHQDHSDKDRKIYWRRNGYTTREMEHYEIEDLFFKRRRSILEIKLEKNQTPNFSCKILLINVGKVIGEKIMVQLVIPSITKISGENWEKQDETFFHRASYHKYVYFENEYPVFPRVPFEIGILYHPKEDIEIKKLSIGFLITCADMELKKGKINLEGDKLTFEYIDEGIPVPDLWVVQS